MFLLFESKNYKDWFLSVCHVHTITLLDSIGVSMTFCFQKNIGALKRLLFSFQ